MMLQRHPGEVAATVHWAKRILGRKGSTGLQASSREDRKNGSSRMLAAEASMTSAMTYTDWEPDKRCREIVSLHSSYSNSRTMTRVGLDTPTGHSCLLLTVILCADSERRV